MAGGPAVTGLNKATKDPATLAPTINRCVSGFCGYRVALTHGR